MDIFYKYSAHHIYYFLVNTSIYKRSIIENEMDKLAIFYGRRLNAKNNILNRVKTGSAWLKIILVHTAFNLLYDGEMKFGELKEELDEYTSQ